MDPVEFFVEASTMGTILVLLVYLASNIALPFYYKNFRPAEFSKIKHVLLPALGVVAIVIPLFYLVKPGQPAAVQLVPLRSAHHPGRLDPVCRIPHPKGPNPE
jgi:hypothetical protein